MTENELILTSVCGCRRIDLYVDPKPLDQQQRNLLNGILQRRQRGEPLQYILKETEFMGISFQVDQRVLIPRPETELLVEQVLKIKESKKDNPLKVCDIGTGSGNIAVSLAKMIDDILIVATDISPEALACACDNAKRNGVEKKIQFQKSDLFDQLEQSHFDLIISNPPYIPSGQINQLAPEIQSEPRLALDGGEDGLDFYRRILKDCRSFLKEGGQIIFEIGNNQIDELSKIIKAENFSVFKWVKDYNHSGRILVLG